MKTYLTQLVRSGSFTAILLLLFLGSSYSVMGQTTVTLTTADNGNTVTIPANATNVTVEVWGAGGGGGAGTKDKGTNIGAGGGGGGAYSRSIGISPGTYDFLVGTGGATGAVGDPTWFDNIGTIYAEGGTNGVDATKTSPGAGGAGGNAANGIGNDLTLSGVNGSDAVGAQGGNGGAGANGGGAGGAGGNNTLGGNGTPPGGGGGGGSGNNDGGVGGDGQIVITYTVADDKCPSSTAIAPTLVQDLCQGDASSELTATITTSGSTGNPTFQYQWYYNTSNSNTVAGATLIASATSQTYTPLTTAAEAGDRWYFCVGYATDNNCAQTNADQDLASNAVQVTVNETPTTATAGSPQTICEGDTATLGANTPTIGTGAWSVVSGPSTSLAQFASTTDPGTIFTPAGGAGDYVLRWTISNSPCTPSTSDVTITVNAQPTVSNAGGPQTICDGDGVVLGANSPTSGTGAWTIVSGPNTSDTQFTSTTDPGTTFTPTGGIGDYVLRWTISNDPCTPSTSDVTITVITIPDLPVITGPTTVIDGNDYTYSITPVAAATNYTWSWPGNPGAWTYVIGQGTASLTVTAGSQGGDITVFVTNNCGDGPTATLSVNIGTPPDCPESTTISPTTIQDLCQETSAQQLSASITTSGGSGSPTLLYQWYYNTSNSNTVAGATLISGATSQTYTPQTTASEIGDRWYFCVGYATDNGCAQTNTTQSLASNAVQVSVSGTPTTASAGGPQTICDGDAATLGANTPTNGTGAWTIVSGPSTSLAQFTSTTDPGTSFTPAGGEGDYVLRWTISNDPCTASSADVTITVNPQPTTSNAGGPQTICDGNNATLSANTPTTGTGAWTVVSGPSTSLAQFTSTTDPGTIFTPAGGIGDYVLRWTISNSPCTPSTSDVTITVITTPTTPGAISGPSNVTPAESGITYSISAVPSATSYTWSINPLGTWSIDSGQGSTSITVTSGALGEDVDISVTATNACGTSSASSISVTVTNAALPPTITLGTIAAVCSGSGPANLPYSATTDTPDKYSIKFNTPAITAGFVDVTLADLTASPITITVPGGAPAGNYYAQFTVTNSTSGLTSTIYNIVVPVIEAPSTPTIYGQSNVPQNSTGFDYSTGAVPGATSYVWSVPTGWTITSGQNTNYMIATTGAAGQNGDVTVTVTNPCGSNNQSFAVTVSDVTNHVLYNCNSCHITHTSPGNSLTNVAGNALLCQSCHNSLGAAGDKPQLDINKATPGVSGQSHSWNVPAVNSVYQTNLPSHPQMSLRTPLENGVPGTEQLICSTCHNQHNSAASNPYLRASNEGDAMCKDCHSIRDVATYGVDTANRGSHPVGVTYDGGDSRFNVAGPVNTQLVTSKVECSSCHGVHDIDITGGDVLTSDGNLLRTTNDINLCMDCHNYEVHNGMDCLDCHEVHNTVDGTVGNNIFMIKDVITTPNSGDKTVVFTSRTGTNSFADGDTTYDGVCEVCHTTTSHYRNNGTAPDQDHTSQGGQDGQDCIGCHEHGQAFQGGDCISCHSIQQGSLPRPQITGTGGEFDQTSSHIGKLVENIIQADCQKCHYNGGTAHKDGSVSLVDPDNTTVQYNPNYTEDLDVWCVKCHDGTPPAGITFPGGDAKYNKASFIATPHDYAVKSCLKCHNDHGSPNANLLLQSTNYLVCNTCHTSGGDAATLIIDEANKAVTGVSGNSHAWDIAPGNFETNTPSNPTMSARLEAGKVVCSTCHDAHDNTNTKFLVNANNTDQMCKDCHSARDVQRYQDGVSNKGSHPVGVAFSGTGNVKAAPTGSVVTIGGNVECSSCHQTHNAATSDGNLLRQTNNATLCTDCHTYGSHNGQDCLVCHEVHNTDKGNIYMIRSSIVTPNSGTKTVNFTAETGTNSFADGDGTYDGVCEVCHTTTSHYQNDGNASDQSHTSQGGQDGADCTTCHAHSGNFAPVSCHVCHEEPGTPNQLYPLTGSHEIHAGPLYAYGCSTCHFERGLGGANEGSHPSGGNTNVVFNPNGLATRGGLDSNTPSYDPATKTCDNIYCHSTGTTANRFSEGVAVWNSSSSTTAPVYATTPAWDTGSITQCNACHEGPSTMPSAPNYTVQEGNNQGLVTATSQYPLTGAHGSQTGAHNSPDQLIILTEGGTYGNALNHNWPFVQCFWCHNNDSGAASGVPKKQGTYGTARHVDGRTWFYPFWYGYDGMCEKTSGGQAPDYYTMDTQAECESLGNGYVWHPAPADPENGHSMIPGLGYSWVGPTNKHCGNGKNCW